jgi:hypothetical protein
VIAVPHRIEDPVGEPEAQDVQNGLLGQEMVDAEHVVLVERPRDQLIEGLRVGEVGTEGLLDDNRGVRGQRPASANACRVGRNNTFGNARYTAIGAAAPSSAARRS